MRKQTGAEPAHSSLYTKEYFLSGACEGYDSYLEGTISKVKEKEINLLDVSSGMRVLDVGCGRGEVASELNRRAARVVAIDYSAAAVQLTRELVPPSVPVVRADATRLPFQPSSFDRVLLGDVIEHIPWTLAQEALAEIGRVLRPDGTVLVHTAPNAWFSRIVLPVLRKALPILGLKGALERIRQYDEDRDEMHPNELSPLGLRRLVREAGLAGDVWVDPDVLRSGASAWTRDVQGSKKWRLIAGIGGAWPFRLILGNDLYARASRHQRRNQPV